MLYTVYFPRLVSHDYIRSKGKTQDLTSELSPQSLNLDVSKRK